MKRVAYVAALVLALAACEQAEQLPSAPTEAAETRPDAGWLTALEWARDSLVPLQGVDPGRSDDSDLATLAEQIGDARVVLISEGFHNCSEMMRLHHRIIRYLVEKHGFNTVVTESGLPESRLIHDYVRGEPAANHMWERGLNKMYGEWTEGRALIEWMRTHSQTLESPLSYYGADIAGFHTDWRPPFGQLLTYLKSTDPEYAKTLDAELSPLLDALGDKAGPNYLDSFGDQERAELSIKLERAVAHIRGQREAYTGKSTPQAYSWALQTALALLYAENYYRNYRERTAQVDRRDVGLNGRELAMSQGVLWALEQRPDAKLIVINHVIHTKTKTQYQGKAQGHLTPMGALLTEALGDELFVLGMAYGGGRFWKDWQLPAERSVHDIPATKEGGFETLLTQASREASADQYLLPLRTESAAAKAWLETTTVMRENDHFITLEPREWDALIYLDQVGPATPVSPSPARN
jgi:erythromycin esterase